MTQVWHMVEGTSVPAGKWTFNSLLTIDAAKALDHQRFLEYEMGIASRVKPHPLVAP